MAGDDGALAERVGDTLAGLGWSMWATARSTLLHVSPDELCGAEWVLAAYPFELGGLPVAWRLSARSHRNSAMTERNAYFTAGSPYEALADLLVAIDACAARDGSFPGSETVLKALTAQGWIHDMSRPRTTATAPGFFTSISLEVLPPLVEDTDPHPDLAGWQAWEELVLGAPELCHKMREEDCVFRRRARAHREFREAQREALALLQMHSLEPPPFDTGQAEPPASAGLNAEATVSDSLPSHFSTPSRQDVAGFMMRWLQPLVIDGEIHACPDDYRRCSSINSRYRAYWASVTWRLRMRLPSSMR
ncbi:MULTISPECIES: DUF317 domain-containing protein [Streptomyces]|uniref:DUF317 domain-containing protein n=1 Tax=Streptomyces ramulosus TaxID=47762 RepID=A0ABW1FLT0_9ACTN